MDQCASRTRILDASAGAAALESTTSLHPLHPVASSFFSVFLGQIGLRWVGNDAALLSAHFRAPLKGHGREGVQMLLDAGINVGQKGRRAGLEGEDALKPRLAAPVASGLRPSRMQGSAPTPEHLARSARSRADRWLTSRPVERAYGPLTESRYR